MADLKKSGMIFDIQSLSLHDGPGIRTVIFLKGCPLNCLWCANPEGKERHKEVGFHKMNCIGCLACAEACSGGAITAVYQSDGKVKPQIDRSRCRECGGFECVEACCNNGLKIIGREASVEEIMRVVKRDMPYYRNNGGVTLSGGDPVYQHEFAVEILKACKEAYLHTAIESAMFVGAEVLDGFMPYTDLFLADIKHMDSGKHRELTGVSNEVILTNIARVAKSKDVVVRIPVIPGLNDDEGNIRATALFCLENGIERVNLLPYHRLGVGKYEQLGVGYGIEAVGVAEGDRMEEIGEIVRGVGVLCL